MVRGELYTEKYMKGEGIHCIVRRVSTDPDPGQEKCVAALCVQVEWAGKGGWRRGRGGGLHTLTRFYLVLATTVGCFPPG